MPICRSCDARCDAVDQHESWCPTVNGQGVRDFRMGHFHGRTGQKPVAKPSEIYRKGYEKGQQLAKDNADIPKPASIVTNVYY